MRTTLDIDDDVLVAVKDLAKAEGRTMGDVISNLVRRALTSPAPGLAEEQSAFKQQDYPAFPTFPKRGGMPVTTEMVRRIQDEVDLEDGVAGDSDLAWV